MRINHIPVVRRLFLLLVASSTIAFTQVRIHSQSPLPGAALTQPYNFQIVAAAGTTPYAFMLASGALPTGITFSATGLLSGTPTATGDFTFTVRVTDAVATFSSRQFQLNVAATPLTVNVFPPTAPQQLGKLLNVSWVGAGGTPPYNYNLISGFLPAGAFFTNSDCFCLAFESIQGAPTSSGDFDLVVGVTDSRRRTATANISFSVAPYNRPFFQEFGSIDGLIGQEVDVTYQAIGGHAPLVVSLAPGSTLPPGLTLSSSGRVRGVVTTPGEFGYNLQITDSVGTVGPFSAAAFFSDVGSGSVITTRSPLQTGAVNQPYSKQIFVTSPFVTGLWTIAAGSLPPGLNINNTGLISGTPTQAGTFNFTVQYLSPSVQKAFTLVISPALLRFSAPSSPFTTVRGQTNTVLFSTSGPPTPPTFEMVNGAWPPGMDFAGNGFLIGAARSNPGPVSFSLRATAADGQEAVANFVAQVQPTPPLTILTPGPNLANAIVGVPYRFTDWGGGNQNFQQGGADALHWSLVSGTLPPGLTLYADGNLVGTPTTPGVYNFTLQLLDGFDTSVTRAFTINVLGSSGSLSITGPASPLPPATSLAPYSQQVTLSGGTAPFTWTIAAGALPPGFSLTNTGLITGTTSNSGTFNFTVQVTDSQSASSGGPLIATRAYQLTVGVSNPVITSLSPNSIVEGSPAFTLTINGSGFASPSVTWNSVLLTVTSSNATQIQAQVPATLVATFGTATVLVLNGDESQTNPATFTITRRPPVITQIAPTSASLGAPGFTLVVTGTGFFFGSNGSSAQSSVVTWNGQDLLTTGTATQASATVPASLLTVAGNAVIRVRNSDGQLSNTATFSVVSPPVLTSLDPNSASALTGPITITLNGANFVSGARVVWNNLDLTRTFVSSTQLTAIIPANLLVQAGTADVRVTNPDGQSSQVLVFTIRPPQPVLTSLDPNSASALTGPITITLNGANFVSGARVVWNNLDLTRTFVSSTQLTAIIPANLLLQAGTVDVRVTNPDGQSSQVLVFTIRPPQPVLTSLDPNSASALTGPITITLNGSNFVSGARVVWNNLDLTRTFVNSTQLTAIIPANLLLQAGTADVRVTNPDGQSSQVRIFTIRPPQPVLTSLDPNSAFALTGPITITLNGANFVSGARVVWNNLDLSRTFVGPTQLTAIVPENLLLQAGTADVRVTNPDGQSSQALVFTIRPPQPVLTKLTPDRANAGSPDTTVVIEGLNFRPNIRVDFNGEPVTAFFDSPTQVRAIIDAGHLLDPVVAPILLRTADGGFSNTLDFTVIGVNPVISSLSPDSRPAGSPTFQLTVNGTSFNIDAIVLWNGVPLVTAFQGSQKLISTVPASLLANPGTAQVTVRNVRDNKTSVARSFAITGTPPSILTIAPNQIPVGSPQTTIVVTGANFLSGALVRLNNVDLETTFGSATQLSAVIPATLLAAQGVFPVIVRNPDGQLSNPADFTVTTGAGAPQITSLAPPSTQAGSPAFTLTVSGANFVPGATVRWNGADLTTTFQSAAQLTASVPSSLVAAAGSAQVTVRNPDQQTSTPATFTIGANPPPSITTLTPSTAVAGSAAFSLNVQGLNFQTGAVVRWNGADLVTSFTSSTQLTANVGAALVAVPGTFSVTVRNPDSQVSAPSAFLVTAQGAPTISSLNPAILLLGSPASPVVVTGTNFQSGAVVRWNSIDLVTAFGSTTQLTATVPATLLAIAGVAEITVRNPDSQLSNAVPITVSAFPPPVLSSLNPNAVNAASPAFTLAVSGANFTPGSVLLWNGNPLTATFVNSTQLTLTIPANLVAFAGAATIQVRNPDGQTSTALVLPIRLLTPQITGLSPLSILAGAEELALTVNAVNVQIGAVILWNGIQLNTSVTLANPSTLPSTLRADVFPLNLFASPGTVSIAIRNPDGQTSAGMNFYIVAPPPQITSLDPSTVFAGAPGSPLTVRGSGFRAQSQIRWNGQPLATTVLGPNQLLTAIPSEFIFSPNTVNITVVNSDGAVSNSLPLTIAPSLIPEITQLTPASAPAGSPALTLTVLGRNYYNGSKVFWNGSELTTTFGSPTQLAATVPAPLLASAGAVTITVRNPDAKQSPGVIFAVGEPLRITSSAQLPVAVRGSTYLFNFTATGGARPYKWRLATASGRLPAGLLLAEDGTLSGTPTVDGAFPLNVEVVDASNAVERQNATLAVDNRDLDISSTSPLPPATAGVPYSYQLRANSSGAVQLAWSVIEGVLPAGLTLNAQTGEISGIPEEAEEPVLTASRAATVPVRFNFRIQVAAVDRNPARKVFELTVLPAGGPFRITTVSLPQGTRERPYRLQIAAVGGAVPYTFTIEGRLPDGVSFSAGGTLEGTPREEGNFNLSVTARDRNQAQASQSYEWIVAPVNDGPLISSGPLLPIIGVGMPIDVIVEATQGQRPFTWSIISGTLPEGVTFDPVTGRFSGATLQEGAFLFTVRVTDGGGRFDQRVLQLSVSATGEPLDMVTQALPNSTLGRAYTFTLQARGGKGPYRWSLNSGTLPAGLRLEGDQILGTATAVSAATLAIRLTDSFGFQLTRDFTLRSVLDALPAIQITGLPDRIDPGQQPQLGVELTAPYPVEVTGRIDLDFAPEPAVSGVTSTILFNTGGRSAEFRIPAGQTRALFSQSVLALQTGTLAGAVTLRLSVSVAGQPATPVNLADRTIRINHLPPQISSVSLERRTGGFNILVTGFSTTRELSEATVVLTPVPGREIQQTRFVLSLTGVFRAWFDNSQSLPLGSQFQLTLPFDGDAAAVQSLTIRLRNSTGESEERRLN